MTNKQKIKEDNNYKFKEYDEKIINFSLNKSFEIDFIHYDLLLEIARGFYENNVN